MKLKPTSAVYSILNGTRQLRAISKLNKHCSFHRSLLIDREVRARFKSITRSRAGY